MGLVDRILHGLPETVKTGDAGVDDHLLVLAPDHTRAGKAFKHPELRELVLEVFRAAPLLETSVVAEGGELTVPTAELKHSDYRRLLELMAKAARSVDRVALDVNVLGGERQALSHAGKPRCAYCHEDVTGEETDLVACSSCSTVLHEACWADNGHCPLLGCTGKTPERARTS